MLVRELPQVSLTWKRSEVQILHRPPPKSPRGNRSVSLAWSSTGYVTRSTAVNPVTRALRARALKDDARLTRRVGAIRVRSPAQQEGDAVAIAVSTARRAGRLRVGVAGPPERCGRLSIPTSR